MGRYVKDKSDHERWVGEFAQKCVVTGTLNFLTLKSLCEAVKELTPEEFTEAAVGAFPVPTYRVVQIYKRQQRRPSERYIHKLEKAALKDPING